MKTKVSLSRSIGLFVVTLVFVAQSTSSAADVTGDRLNIGAGHSLTGTDSSIAGGFTNRINADYATIAGGYSNTNTSSAGFIGGGQDNSVSVGIFPTIAGGYANRVTGSFSFIGGGEANLISGDDSTIGSGYANLITNAYTVVAGGYGNIGGGYISVVGGGFYNTNNAVSGTISGGGGNRTTGDYSTIAGGLQANAPLYGQSARASGAFAVPGDAQASEYILRRTVTTTNATELFLDGTTNRMTIPSGATWAFEALVVARGGTNSAGYQVKGVIENNSGTTALVGSATTTTLGEDISSWNATALADNTFDALVISVTNDASTNRWVATVRTTEVKF
jgi:hypothetical protein